MVESETKSEPRLSWPADYYSSATPAQGIPRWAKFGCGVASLVILLVVFGGGAFLSSGGFADFMDLVLGMSVGEMKGMYASTVTAEQKRLLETEIEELRRNLREGKTSMAALQPFLEVFRKTTGDNTVTVEEVEILRREARKAANPRRR